MTTAVALGVSDSVGREDEDCDGGGGRVGIVVGTMVTVIVVMVVIVGWGQ